MKKFLTLFLFVFISVFAFSQEEILDLDDEMLSEILSDDEEEYENQREFIIIMSDKGFNLNPHTATYSSEAQVLDSLYEGLFSYDPKTLEPKPAVCESFKISRSKKRWTFKIRENLEFSSGEKITAQTVRDSWIGLLKTPNAPYASMLDCVSGAKKFRENLGSGNADESSVGISVRDDYTLVVSLDLPAAHLPRILCHHAFSVCPSDSSKKGVAGGVFSGAFVLKEVSQNEIVLEKNEKYWDSENVHLPSIRILCSDDVSENSWKFNTGRVDWISGMVDTNKLLNKNSLRISAVFGTEYIFFSCRKAPWTEADFRNALLAAVPWEILRRDSLVKAQTFIYPLAGYPNVEGLSETSLEDAVDMMKSARKKYGIPENEKLSIVYGISKTSERQKSQYEILKEAWEPLGVELSVQTTLDERYVDSLPTWNADLFSYSWIGDFADPLAFLELFRENSTLNPSDWKSPEYTKLLDEAAFESNGEEHYKLLSQAEQVLLDDGVVLPIAHSVSLHAINLKSVGGWYTNPLDIHPYKYLYLKHTSSQVPNVVMR